MMRPYKFAPNLKTTLWGGDRIAAFKGLSDAYQNVGESWEISGLPGAESVTSPRGIADDPDIGVTLTDLISRHGDRLLGARVRARFGDRFPLLVKFIDAREDLSIQVHPNDARARARGFDCGKTEMWYVLRTDPGAMIRAGLRQPLTPARYDELVRETSGNPFEDVLASYASRPGDCYFMPAGCLHGIGAGNFLVEIQQSSDVTYRVCDFGRRDAAGRLRTLHVAEAREAIDFGATDGCRRDCDPSLAVCELVACPYFRVSRVVAGGAVRIDPESEAFVIVVCLSGAAVLNGVAVRQGETLLVPAVRNALDIEGDATFLTATL